MVRQRHPPSKSKAREHTNSATSAAASSQSKMRASADIAPPKSWQARNQSWIMLAVGSGACAAFNGAFAKLYGLSQKNWSFLVMIKPGGLVMMLIFMARMSCEKWLIRMSTLPVVRRRN
jgi:hypothetical protein